MTKTQDRSGRWPVWLLAVVLYPLAAGAAYVNLFFLFLMAQAIGFSVISTLESILGGLVLGLPLAWIAARWFRRMIDEAEDEA